MAGNGADRRTRLRLARQHPRPGRVRPRERTQAEPAGQPTSDPVEDPSTSRWRSFVTWWRGVDWAKWGTIAGIFVGAVGLFCTAIATYYGARVSSNELDQAKKEAADQARSQAARVTFWNDDAVDGVPQMHVMNRSPDPVSDVVVVARVGVPQNDKTTPLRPEADKFFLAIGNVAPCTDFIITADALVNENNKRVLFSEHVMALEVVFVSFDDSGGAEWVRTVKDLLKADDPSVDTEVQVDPDEITQLYLAPVSVTQAQQATSCGSA